MSLQKDDASESTPCPHNTSWPGSEEELSGLPVVLRTGPEGSGQMNTKLNRPSSSTVCVNALVRDRTEESVHGGHKVDSNPV